MSYTAEEKRDILVNVIKIALRYTRTKPGYAPDFFVDAAIQQAKEFIEKYQDQPEIDIWKQARLDYYTQYLARKLLVEYSYDYELSDENFEAVNALIEAEEMLGAKASDDDLYDLFDYAPEELERLRIIAEYLTGIDAERTTDKFIQKYCA